VAAWIEALTFNRVWDEDRDAPRLRDCFRKLVGTGEKWPVPAEFLRNLPPVEERLALPAKVVSDEVAQQNIAKIRAMLSETTWPVYSSTDVEDEEDAK
jgi:hypothetical protein